MPAFKRRLEWFVEHRADLIGNVACMITPGIGERRLMSIVDERQLRAILRIMLDEQEFLSPYGIRALSRIHWSIHFVLSADGQLHDVAYGPGVSASGLFGGNSNWLGPSGFLRISFSWSRFRSLTTTNLHRAWPPILRVLRREQHRRERTNGT